jgi:hypothetical protein
LAKQIWFAQYHYFTVGKALGLKFDY